MDERQAELTFADYSAWDMKMRERATFMISMFTKSCQSWIFLIQKNCLEMIQNKEFMNWMRNSKFDLVFGHAYDICNVGVAHSVGIPFIWLNRYTFYRNKLELEN